MKKTKVFQASIICLMVLLSVTNILDLGGVDTNNFFTLVAKYPEGNENYYDTLFTIKTQLKRIGIDIDIIPYWSWFGELIAFRDFDMVYLELNGGGLDPDFTGLYNENGSLNIFGYHTSMDYNETLGTGVNEWYMKQGRLITPPDSQERVRHYWDWEQYLLDKICPMKPMFVKNKYEALWGNLAGYNSTKGLLQSWGKMSWEGTHLGQLSQNEIVIADYHWSDLNPLFQDDVSSSFICSAIMDPLIWYDADQSTWPHLAENFYYINDTHFRVKMRENIQWQEPPTGSWSTEYLDAEDVYFTFYAWKNISNNQHQYDFIKEMEIIDKYTIDFIIDGNPSTPEQEVYANALPMISVRILPEHFLNQTQILDGITPDILHESWNTFATNSFGTGLFYLSDFIEGSETTLSLFESCWRLNSSITDDMALNWKERFGTFSNDLDQLRIKIFSDPVLTLNEFEAGLIDIIDITNYKTKRDDYQKNTDLIIYNDTVFNMGFVGYNMRPVRAVIGNPNPAPGNPDITIGLAIRKAINYAIDRNEINSILYSNERAKTYWPIYSKMTKWCNPEIIRYEHDYSKAKEYMEIAGYEFPTIATHNSSLKSSLIIGVISLISTVVLRTILKKKKVKIER